MKEVEGVAELHWDCPYKTCKHNNVSCLDNTVEAKSGKYGYECEGCDRIVNVIY